MNFFDTLAIAWPYLVTAVGGSVPIARWYARRAGRLDDLRARHEERRTKAIEQIPPMVSELQATLKTAFIEHHATLREAIRDSQAAVIEAIRADRLERLERAVRQGSSPQISK